MFDMQALVDGMSAQWQRERSKTQLTLGLLIAALESMPPESRVANLCAPHSYRGYYCDLAFELTDGTRAASELLAECKGAMGKVFTGYKGGDFVMGALTPLWVSKYGESEGVRLISVSVGGGIETAEEDVSGGLVVP
ncbi:MAG: hypothetical protein PHX83_11895 [Acidobacteriia bacterium]|nr:hypothetical protein [Terriglobia bacterium]